jgi:hypothetical protein
LENAESGVPAVETDLDKRYEAGKDGSGNDVKRDLSTTVKWYHVAAAKVYTCAQHNIDCEKTDEAHRPAANAGVSMGKKYSNKLLRGCSRVVPQGGRPGFWWGMSPLRPVGTVLVVAGGAANHPSQSARAVIRPFERKGAHTLQ